MLKETGLFSSLLPPIDRKKAFSGENTRSVYRFCTLYNKVVILPLS